MITVALLLLLFVGLLCALSSGAVVLGTMAPSLDIREEHITLSMWAIIALKGVVGVALVVVAIHYLSATLR